MMLNKNIVRPDRVLLDHVEFPFQREKYIAGAFFWAHLAFDYGLERAAQFFKYFSTKVLIQPDFLMRLRSILLNRLTIT